MSMSEQSLSDQEGSPVNAKTVNETKKGEYVNSKLAWTLFLAFLPNVLIGLGLILWQQHAEWQHTDDEHRYAVVRADAEHRYALVSEDLSAASDVVIALYPLGDDRSVKTPARSSGVVSAERNFERLFWGNLGLIPDGPLKECLKELRESLFYAASGYTSSRNSDEFRAQQQYKLQTIAADMREMIIDEKVPRDSTIGCDGGGPESNSQM